MRGLNSPAGRALCALPRRIAPHALVLGAAAGINFALPRLAPGGPIDILLPPDQSNTLTAAQRASVIHQFGLDQSTWVQLRQYVLGLLHGDLGFSIRYARPVRDLLLERLPWTLLLVGGAVVMSTLLGAALGFRSGWRRGSGSDVRTMTGVVFLDSVPPFMTGLVLILVFSVSLHVFPIYGALPTVPLSGPALVGAVLQRLVLPLTTLTIATLAPTFFVARSALIAELDEDYVLMARAKGLDERGVRRHARRNALLPLWTVVLLNVGTVLGGAAVVETVFSYPGLGSLFVESVVSRDYPVLEGSLFVVALCVVAANAVADVLYPLVDPRVRRPGRAAAA